MQHTGSGKLANLGVPITVDREMKERLEAQGWEFDVQTGRSPFIADDEQMARMKALLAKIEKKFKAREPIFRDAQLFREWTGAIFKLPEYEWFSQVYTDPDFQKMSPNGHVDTHSAFMTWVVRRLRSVSATSNWFRPSEGLVYSLLATDLKGTIIADLKVPMDAFYIELPPRVFYLEDRRTGWHEVRSMGIILGRVSEKVIEMAKAAGDETALITELGERLVIDVYGEPNTNSTSPFDDTWLFKSYRIEDKEADIEKALVLSPRMEEYERALNRGKLGEQILDGLEIRRFLLRFVLNFCIYLGSEKATMKPLHEEEIKKLHGGKKFKNLRKNVQQKIRDLQNDRVFLVGTDIGVDNELRDIVRAGGTGSHQLTYRTLVRGHWRNQAHGPGWGQRTRKWIRPHIRGADLPTPIVGHNYKVE